MPLVANYAGECLAPSVSKVEFLLANQVQLVLHYLFLLSLYIFVFYILVSMLRSLQLLTAGGETTAGTRVHGIAGSDMQAMLVKVEDNGIPTARVYPLQGEVRMGRAPENQVLITDARVSRHHARLFFSNGQYWLEDLNSKNGTFLNGKRLNGPVVLTDGDRVKIGAVMFVFVRWRHAVEQDVTRGVGAYNQ